MAQNARTFGHIPGVPFGTRFRSRDALIKAGVHGLSQAGIHGDSKEGAFSICMSEGYEDNRDRGETITYVGSGGQNSRGEQVENQSRDHPPNKALWISSETKLPVRVIRGKNKKNHYAPPSGYRYDGLYVVDSAEEREGEQGYTMCFYELRRIKDPGDGDIPHRRLLDSKKLSAISRLARSRRR